MYLGFFSDEPMSKALSLYDGTNRFEDGDNYVLSSLEQCLSMVALDAETDRVLGINPKFLSLLIFLSHGSIVGTHGVTPLLFTNNLIFVTCSCMTMSSIFVNTCHNKSISCNPFDPL